MRRHQFITILGGAAVAWPVVARTQQTAMPMVGFLNAGSANASARYAAGFRVTVEYHWPEGQYDRPPALVADLVRRRVVAVIATPGIAPAVVVKAATATIPIIFGVAEDPVRLGWLFNIVHAALVATKP